MHSGSKFRICISGLKTVARRLSCVLRQLNPLVERAVTQTYGRLRRQPSRGQRSAPATHSLRAHHPRGQWQARGRTDGEDIAEASTPNLRFRLTRTIKSRASRFFFWCGRKPGEVESCRRCVAASSAKRSIRAARGALELPIGLPFGCDLQPDHQCAHARQPDLYASGL